MFSLASTAAICGTCSREAAPWRNDSDIERNSFMMYCGWNWFSFGSQVMDVVRSLNVGHDSLLVKMSLPLHSLVYITHRVPHIHRSRVMISEIVNLLLI